MQEKIARLGEFAGFAGFLFHDVEPDPALLDERILGAAESALGDVEPWAAETIEAALKQLCDDLGEKPRTVYLPIRVAVTGSRVSPGLYESLELLGKETSLDAAPGRRGGGARERAATSSSATELGPTSWIEVTQERIDAFAAATDDPQWIHVDAERAAEGPFGTTIAHGFLTLSLCVPMLYEILPERGAMAVNYGTNRVRFPAAGAVRQPDPRTVPRARASKRRAAGARATIEATVECEGVDKPVCVAELVVLTVS